MLREEFESRYGKEVSDSEFDMANEMYIYAGNMDKDTFVEDYRNHKESKILTAFLGQMRSHQKSIDELEDMLDIAINIILKSGNEKQAEGLHSFLSDKDIDTKKNTPRCCTESR